MDHVICYFEIDDISTVINSLLGCFLCFEILVLRQ